MLVQELLVLQEAVQAGQKGKVVEHPHLVVMELVLDGIVVILILILIHKVHHQVHHSVEVSQMGLVLEALFLQSVLIVVLQ